jgi:protease-4
MKRFFVRLFVFLGVLYLVSIAVSLFIILGQKGHVPSKTILEADFEKPLVEDIPDNPTARVMLADTNSLRDTIDAIDRGANDDRVVGMVAKIGAGGMGMAQVQEIREAVQRFRAKKKFAIAFSESFGEFGPGNGGYYLATAFDQIFLQPSGDVGLTGLIIESPFIKGTLAKLGMPFHGDHRYEYKSALNTLTETSYTPAEREENQAIINSWFSQMKDGISQARQIPPDQFQALVDHGPYLGKEAQDAKLVDGLAYRDEVYDQAKKRGGDAELLYLDKYVERAGRPHDSGKEVALVFGVGEVARGKGGYDPVMGQVVMGTDTVAAAIRAAAEDKSVKAILFRVDSPGGSYVGSDMVWREVVRARKAGKPVIVSMGNLAGSGGYFVAMAADKIVAQPGTITASIGVLSGKFLTSGFWDKVGLSWDEVHDGANATMFTGTHDYTPAEWQRFQSWLDRVYNDFTSKAAEGRNMPKDKILQVAKGRIWTGEDAKNLGLVDELGGYDTALKLAKKAAGIPESDEVKLVVFPHKKNFLESLLQRQGPDSSDKEGTQGATIEMMRAIQPLARKLNDLGALNLEHQDAGDDVLRMRILTPGR